MNSSTVALTPFALGQGIVETIQSSVNVNYVEPNLLRITYLAKGDIVKLKIPAKCSPRRAERLWEHSCFEAFLRADGDPAYYEFNFAPSGEWAAYSFHGYRAGMAILNDSGSPEVVVRHDADKLALDAVVRWDRLPAIRPGSLLRIGLSAVIESSDSRFSYWALKHPAVKPDFHHPDAFALELALPSQPA